MKVAAIALASVAGLCVSVWLAAFALPSLQVLAAADHVFDKGDLAFHPHVGARLSLDSEVVDERGRAVELGGYFDRTPVLFGLECLRCKSLCSLTLENLIEEGLNRLPLEAGRDYQVVGLSIDPRDAPRDAAAAHAKCAALMRRGDGAGLHFLTTSAGAARRIADAVGFSYRYDRSVDAYLHPAGFVVAFREGEITQYGVGATPVQLLAAVANEQRNHPQSLISRIVLWCHVQGAPIGRFTTPVMAALMLLDIGAGVTLFVVFRAIRRQG